MVFDNEGTLLVDGPPFIYIIDFITDVVALPLYICMIMSLIFFKKKSR